MSDTAGGTPHGQDPKQSEGDTGLNKETAVDFERKSSAVTAAGVAFILLTLLALRPFTNINLALPLETHFRLIPFYGVQLASVFIFAFTALATILRWRRWRIWAGAAAWLAIFLVFRSIQSMALTTRFLSQGATINPEQLILTVLMLAISAFALWAWHQEGKTAPMNVKSEVTVAGIMLVFFGVSLGLGAINVPSTGLSLFLFVTFLIFATAGLAMILRWRGWRIWVGTVSWLMIVIMVLGTARDAFPSMFIDLWRLTFVIFAILVCIFVLWAKRQDTAVVVK